MTSGGKRKVVFYLFMLLLIIVTLFVMKPFLQAHYNTFSQHGCQSTNITKKTWKNWTSYFTHSIGRTTSRTQCANIDLVLGSVGLFFTKKKDLLISFLESKVERRGTESEKGVR